MLPVLYSFRRCPYAIRARFALHYSGIETELREVVLADKPAEMLAASPKGTVPVLVLSDSTVIDESIDIMFWALTINDPEHWLGTEINQQARFLINQNDFIFKKHLDLYKYSDRHPDKPAAAYRDEACDFLQALEDRLTSHRFLVANHQTLADIAIFPFIRQFANVDNIWFKNSPYPYLKSWLDHLLGTSIFLEIMKKSPQWKPAIQSRTD